jgi:2-aminoadipate transaminase
MTQLRWDKLYARRVAHMTSSAIRELLKVTEQPGFISFAGGLPAPEVFPVEEVASVSARILRDSGPQALQYGPTEGYRPLRELLAEHMRHGGGAVTVDNVLITTGSQQGIDLVGKILLDPEDAVVVESPTYLATLQAWRAYEARFLGVRSDDHGIQTEHLEELLEQRPKLVYCVPNFQNPSGVTLSVDRRRQLADISLRHGLPIVEDDPYRDVRFEGNHLPRLLEVEAKDRSDSRETYRGNVISLGTFSKILSPGLRVGWVIAAPQVIGQLVQAKQGTDLHTASFNQMIAYEMMRSGFLDRHLPIIVDTYRERRDVMIAALAEHFPEGTTWTRPEGGMFLWVTLPDDIDAEELLRDAIKREVAFVPGRPFHVDGSGANTMRLNFSNSTPGQIRDGIGRLGEVISGYLELRGARSSAVSM